MSLKWLKRVLSEVTELETRIGNTIAVLSFVVFPVCPVPLILGGSALKEFSKITSPVAYNFSTRRLQIGYDFILALTELPVKKKVKRALAIVGTNIKVAPGATETVRVAVYSASPKVVLPSSLSLCSMSQVDLLVFFQLNLPPPPPPSSLLLLNSSQTFSKSLQKEFYRV